MPVPSNVIVAVLVATVGIVFLYTPGPGRRLRHWAMYLSTRKAWQSGRAVVALRVVDGTQPGVGPHWRVGTVIATPGGLEFTRFVGGVSLFKRPAVRVPVVAVGVARPLTGASRLRLDPDCEVASLRTPTATLEIAVLPPIPAEAVLARMR